MDKLAYIGEMFKVVVRWAKETKSNIPALEAMSLSEALIDAAWKKLAEEPVQTMNVYAYREKVWVEVPGGGSVPGVIMESVSGGYDVAYKSFGDFFIVKFPHSAIRPRKDTERSDIDQAFVVLGGAGTWRS